MVHYLTPCEVLLQPQEELEGTYRAEKDKYVYRFVPLSSLLQANEHRDELFLQRVDSWNDPFEKKALIAKYKSLDGESFVHPLANSVYGTCFTECYNSEAQWQYYGKDKSEPIVSLAFQLPRLLDALEAVDDQCFFVGKVDYFLQENIFKAIALHVNQHIATFMKGKDADFSPQEYAELLKPLLIKRLPFSYEREIRIMKVDRCGLRNIHVPIGSFLHLIERITMPPIAPSEDKSKNEVIKSKLTSAGWEACRISQSKLYYEPKSSVINIKDYVEK